VPEVESCALLNAEKLAALIHGTFARPSRAASTRKCFGVADGWADVGRRGPRSEEANPIISLQLTGVDTEGIIERPARKTIKGTESVSSGPCCSANWHRGAEPSSSWSNEFLWKNTARKCELLFAEHPRIFRIPRSRNSGDDWKLIIDLAFDDTGAWAAG